MLPDIRGWLEVDLFLRLFAWCIGCHRSPSLSREGRSILRPLFPSWAPGTLIHGGCLVFPSGRRANRRKTDWPARWPRPFSFAAFRRNLVCWFLLLGSLSEALISVYHLGLRCVDGALEARHSWFQEFFLAHQFQLPNGQLCILPA